MSPHDTILSVRDLHFGYQLGVEVLQGVSLRFEPGLVTAILGANGSGKTTLLKCLLQRLIPCKGEILLGTTPLASYSPKQFASKIAYVPQSPEAAFGFRVRELVLMGRYAHGGVLGIPSANDLAVVEDAMERTDTAQLATRKLGELSGGEAQRVMIARAVAQEPSILLLDEPTSHLDMQHQMRIHVMMRQLSRDTGMAVVCVSHDVNLAARFADHVVLMRKGRVIADGPVADTIREDALRETYDINVHLISVPGLPVPMVIAESEGE